MCLLTCQDAWLEAMAMGCNKLESPNALHMGTAGRRSLEVRRSEGHTRAGPQPAREQQAGLRKLRKEAQ